MLPVANTEHKPHWSPCSLTLPQHNLGSLSHLTSSSWTTNYNITIDHYSDFYELDPRTNTQSSTIIDLINLISPTMAYHCAVSWTTVPSSSQMNIRNLRKYMALNTSLYHLTGLTAMVKPRQLLRMSAEEIPRHLALLNIRNTPPHGHSFSPAQQLMGRCTLSTLPTYRDLLKPEAPDPLIVYTEISCCKEASKTQYDKNVNMDQPPLPLGSHAYTKPRPSRPAGGGHSDLWSYH